MKMTKGCCGSGCPDCPFRPPSQGGLFYAQLPKYKIVTGTNPQVSHVQGTVLTMQVGPMSRPLVGMERIMGC